MKSREELQALNCTPIEDLIEEDFGVVGTPERDAFELECDAFIIGERLKQVRKNMGMTQEELATKVGARRSFISKIENGNTDVRLSTIARVFQGLGRRINIAVI